MKVEFLEADIHYIHGTIAFTAPRGFGMQVDPADEGKLIAANGVSGFQLERDVVGDTTDAEVNARLLETILPTGFAKPYVKGATVSARRVTRMQAEGNDVILTSGTGAVSGSTPINAKLGYKNGKLYVAQSGDEVAWIVRRQLTAEDSANAFRLELERQHGAAAV
jgi:hypothetical protein